MLETPSAASSQRSAREVSGAASALKIEFSKPHRVHYEGPRRPELRRAAAQECSRCQPARSSTRRCRGPGAAMSTASSACS